MHVPIINLDPSEATMHQAILKMCNVHRVLIHFADTACRSRCTAVHVPLSISGTVNCMVWFEAEVVWGEV